MWFGRQWLSTRQACEVCFRDVAFGEGLEFFPEPGGYWEIYELPVSTEEVHQQSCLETIFKVKNI